MRFFVVGPFLILSSLSFALSGTVAMNSMMPNKISLNPAAASLSSGISQFTLTLQQGESNVTADGEKLESGKLSSNQFNFNSSKGQYSLEAEYSPSRANEGEAETGGKNEDKECNLQVNIGLENDWGFKFGTYSRNSFEALNNQLRLGGGKIIRYSNELNVGVGADLVQESGDTSPRVKWLEYYIGVGYSKLTGSQGFQAELNYYHLPEVVAYDDEKYKIAPETQKIIMRGEFVMDRLLLALQHETSNQLSLKGYSNGNTKVAELEYSIGYHFTDSMALLFSSDSLQTQTKGKLEQTSSSYKIGFSIKM